MTACMMSVRDELAAATAGVHQRVDAWCDGFALDTAAGCAGFLAYFANGFAPLEARLSADGAGALYPPFAARRRAHLLPSGETLPLPPFRGAAAVWGALYVMEGARLGNAALAHRHPALARHAYFWPDEKGAWRRFLRALEAADRTLVDREGMVEGARAAFAPFVPLTVPPAAGCARQRVGA
ncbi:MAG: biliverdin-producing heme oxygenase [Pseudomonadota bacterium]